MSLNPSHHLFPHFLNVIGNMSKHLAAEVIGAVSGLRGESGAVLTRELLENIVRVADFFLPNCSVHIKKVKTAEV